MLDPTSVKAHSLTYLSAMSAPCVYKAILVGHTGKVESVTFSPDRQTLAVATQDQTIRLWRLPEGQLLATLTGHPGTEGSVAFSPDGQTLAAAAQDQTIRLWGLPEGQLLATLTGYERPLIQVHFSPDGRTLGLQS